MEFKYIIMTHTDFEDVSTEQIFIFPKVIDHDQMAEAVRHIRFWRNNSNDWSRQLSSPVSAGFTNCETCWGRSETLDLDARPKIDSALLDGDTLLPAYRIWDKTNGCWFKPIYRGHEGKLVDVVMSANGDLGMRYMDAYYGYPTATFVHESCFDTIPPYSEGFEIDKCTGYTDANGRHLYVGDLVGNGILGDPWIGEIIWDPAWGSFMVSDLRMVNRYSTVYIPLRQPNSTLTAMSYVHMGDIRQRHEMLIKE